MGRGVLRTRLGQRTQNTTNPMNSHQERRKVQRIRFKLPLAGTLPTGSISIVDLSISGAKVEHDFPIPAGRTVRLDFLLRGERISLSCSVIRCRLERNGSNRTAYSSGLRFASDAELNTSPLRRLLADIVGRDLEERRKQRRESSNEADILVC